MRNLLWLRFRDRPTEVKMEIWLRPDHEELQKAVLNRRLVLGAIAEQQNLLYRTSSPISFVSWKMISATENLLVPSFTIFTSHNVKFRSININKDAIKKGILLPEHWSHFGNQAFGNQYRVLSEKVLLPLLKYHHLASVSGVATGSEAAAGHHSCPHSANQAESLPPSYLWAKACGQLWVFIQASQYTWQAWAPLTVRSRICHLGSRSFLLLSVCRLCPCRILKGMCHCSQRRGHSKQII